MSNQENFYLDEVISGERKIEYVDKLELLREKVNSKGVLSSRSSKKELIEIVENLIDLMPVELRTARWLVREQDTYLNKAREEANEIFSFSCSLTPFHPDSKYQKSADLSSRAPEVETQYY